MMNERGKSDSCVVSAKLPNNDVKTKASATSAEVMEKRQLAKGNPNKQTTHRTQGRSNVQNALARIRHAAKKDKKQRFTALLHHIYGVDMLRESYYGLKRASAAGIDGVTWQHYKENLEDNLQVFSDRLKRGAYRAKAVKRMYIPKADGKQRPLGILVLEDKIVQGATVLVLNAIYETDILGFSYGYRPQRSQHQCLDALYVGLQTKKVNTVLDADLQGFFDHISHEWLIKFIEHRIADARVVRLIKKWLNAGVLEAGQRYRNEEGTPQGGVISPLLSNIYLHYVFDQWIQQWRIKPGRGDIIVVRWADDLIIGFQRSGIAKHCLRELQTRFKKFSLTLHPNKTRLLEFGPFAIKNRAERGAGKPERFTFLGFDQIVGKKRSNGMFVVIRKTNRKRMRAKLKAVKAELKRRRHEPIPEIGKWLNTVVGGHNRYFGVPTNQAALSLFRYQIGGYWHHTLKRRGQRKSRYTWERMAQLIEHWLPKPKIHHPYPLCRRGVITQGRSRMR